MELVSILHLLLGNNHSGNASFTTAQCELLLCLSSQRIDMETEQKWTPIVGPLEHNIARFVSRGFLEEATLEGKFDAKFRVADLKQILETKGIRVKGKKAEMIAACMSTMTPEVAAGLVADVRLYQPTPAGRHRIEAYLMMKEKARADMEAETFALLGRNDIRRAWSRIARYQTAQMFPDPKWTRGIPEPLLDEAAHLLNFSYDDLPLDEAQRKAVGAHLAMSVLTGESLAETGKRLAAFTTGLFNWNEALAASRPNPCGHEAVAGPGAMAELYATTRIQEALAACGLNSLKSERLGKGIRILPVHCNDCNACNGGKYQYEWSEIEALPKLPRQVGCQCTYAAWL
ncbi:MAG TPA: SAP domain-containing protein [Methanocella sp.]|nr:SAP domain-containing protein [Methanocella sp.]